MKPIKESFQPIINNKSDTLILGTMPGEISLSVQEYYGNSRNQFWKIIYTVFSDGIVDTLFENKINLLQQQNIGLWDVLQACERKGSLDINIRNHIENDFITLLKKYPKIKRILFNGKESHKYFTRKFGQIESIEYFQLPSTSPANTTSFEEKLKLWKEVFLRKL